MISPAQEQRWPVLVFSFQQDGCHSQRTDFPSVSLGPCPVVKTPRRCDTATWTQTRQEHTPAPAQRATQQGGRVNCRRRERLPCSPALTQKAAVDWGGRLEATATGRQIRPCVQTPEAPETLQLLQGWFGQTREQS